MTVKEFIELLSKENQNASVEMIGPDYDTMEVSKIERIGKESIILKFFD